MRVLLTGGGTAGHVNPALAIAETVKLNCHDAEIAFVGTERGKENDLVPREGYTLYKVESMGIKRSLSPSNFKALYLAVASPFRKDTTKILDEFKPDIVIGTGGYACWPIMAAAARRGIPTALHESNAKAGLAIGILQLCVDRIWINFESTRKQLKFARSVDRVGNPLRSGFGVSSKVAAREKLGIAKDDIMVLSFGGSLGAEHVNTAVLDLMKAMSAENPNVRFLHASGKRDYDVSRARFEKLELDRVPRCSLVEYIYDMPLQMAAADLIISRAGAMTLSELAMMGKAAILIPSPNVAANHQYHNAKALADADAAILVEERELADGALIRAVRELLEDSEKTKTMEENVRGFALPDANRQIWNQIAEMIKTKD